MIIVAQKSTTNLSQDYLLETDSTISGCIVTVKTLKRELLGQFTSKRQKIGDNRPVENIVICDPRMTEVVRYFNKAA